MTGVAWFLFAAWTLTVIGWSYTLHRWKRCQLRAAMLDGEVLYLRAELLDTHGTTDWEW